jgi:hypothetical protein
MSPNTIATIVAISLMMIVTIVLLSACGRKLGRTWTAAAEGRYGPAAALLVGTIGFGVVLVEIVVNPPIAISWDEPIRCTQHCGWQYYYILLIIALAVLALVALSMAFVLALVLLKAFMVNHGAPRSTLAVIAIGALTVLLAAALPPTVPRHRANMTPVLQSERPPANDTAQPLREDDEPRPAATPLDYGSASTAGNPTSVALQRACGVFNAVDRLTDQALTPDRAPGQPSASPIDGHALIEYANTFNVVVDRNGLAKPMSAAIAAHLDALTNLGAMVNHHAGAEDIGSMTTITHATAATVDAFCTA